MYTVFSTSLETFYKVTFYLDLFYTLIYKMGQDFIDI